MFLKLLTGEHLKDDKNILYLKNDMFHVECLDENFQIMETTIDGELGPRMPFTVTVLPQAYPIFGKYHTATKKRSVSHETKKIIQKLPVSRKKNDE